MTIRLSNFDVYASLLKEKSGLSLSEDKSYLLESRLKPIADKWGHASVDAMSHALQGVADPALVEEIVEAMTTNETFFFRDNTPFDNFKNVALPYLQQQRAMQRKLRIWCAACSSGQEPYSLAMILKEKVAALGSWSYDIVATDLSNEILEQARSGKYSQFEVQRGLPIQMLMNYFTQDGDSWLINDDIKAMVKYQLFNLLDNPVQFGQLDVIFCRNVLIYFDRETKTEVFERLAKQLAPDGFLFLGGAETVIGLTDEFQALPGVRGMYVKNNSVHLEATGS